MKHTTRMNELTIAFILSTTVPFAANAADHNMADMKGMGGQGMHDMQNMSGMKNMQEAKPGQAAMAEGEVKKVDFEQGKVTLKHGPLDNLGMPAMTMVFKVADAAMLSSINSGDMVKFQADKVDGTLTVTKLEK